MRYIIIILLTYGSAMSQIPAESKYLYTPVNVNIDSNESSIEFDRLENSQRYEFYIDRLNIDKQVFESIAKANELQDSIYTVNNIETGELYEYMYTSYSTLFYKEVVEDGFPYFKAKGKTYLACGRELESYAAKRTVLLLVDSTVYLPLETEIERLKNDLVSEGWGVRLIRLDRTDSVFNMNYLIPAYYLVDRFIKSNTDLNIESIFIIGSVSTWYSGKYAPDDQPNHFGCWPTDGFYGMRPLFLNDYISNNKPNNSSNWDRNNHSPGELAYEYSTYPHRVEQMIGRVDMSDLPTFPESEVELLRRYLNKNHKYRTGQLPFRRRGLIDDKLADEHLREAPASSGWRNFNSMFGADSISEGDYFSTLANESYMASYACGKGQPFDSLEGVGSSKDFATKQVNTIFTMLYGDYIGDWDSPDNFLRASLASEPSILTAAWVGHPHWFMHHMSIGYPIGYSTRLTQNNDIYVPLEHFQTDTTSKPYDPYKNGVHVGLLGDPTLTMYPLDLENSVSNLKAAKVNDFTVRLTWDISDMSTTHFYDVFRSNYADGPFDKVTEVSITDGQFVDEYHHTGDVWYMVREKVLEFSPTASFWKHLRGKLVQTDVKSDVEDNKDVSDITISPNPTSDNVVIRFINDNYYNSDVKVFDSRGNVVKSYFQNIKNHIVWNLEDNNGSRIGSGVYYLKVDNGTTVSVKKIVVVK